MRRTRLSLLLVLGMLAALMPLGAVPAAATTGDLVISGVIDGPLSGGTPKAVEFYVVNDIPDLSIYGVGSANNGGGTHGEEFTFSPDAATAGDFIYVASETPGFNTFFGFDPNYTSGAASINGDDAIELFMSGSVVDVFGDINVDGSGEPWEHLDGWAYRVSGTGQDGTTFVLGNWTFSGPNALDGESTNATAATPFPIGTYAATVVDVPPTVSSVSPADGDIGVAIDGDIIVTFSEPVTVTDPWFGISCATSGAVTATVSGGPAAFTLNPDTDFTNDELCTVSLTAAQIADQDGTPDNLGADYSWSFTTAPSAETITPIHTVQGDGFTSPLVGQIVTIEGVVVGDFQQGDGFPNTHYDNDLDGYYVQEEDADADANPLTSEGIFVRDNVNAVAVGDVVKVVGIVAESFGLTRIQDVTSVEIIVQVEPFTVTPTSVTLPIAGNADFEAVEGMSVLFAQTLVIAEYFNFDRFGEMVLTTDRASQPTALHEPGSQAAADLADLNSRSRISLDDGRGGQNPDPAVHPNGGVFDLTNRFRGGDTVTNLSGVMDYAFGSYKVQPTAGADYTAVNSRPASPDAVGGDLQVATFNVLNYFTTLDGSGSICGPLGNQGCRGADNAEEFTRQRDKIIDAIAVMDADVVGLMEIENDAADVAVANLVDGLNAVTGSGTYAYVATGPVGPDAIRVALIYQPANVAPHGDHAVLAGAFLDPNNLGDDKNRAALAQSFVGNANGGVFTVVVNHLKSKGSSCGTGDDDPEQGSCNLTRTLAAGMLADWLQTDPTGSGDADFFVIGDLNAYDMEDPIDALKARGYTDLVLRDLGPLAYSYVFSGQWGYLDYVMANGAASPQVTGTTIWHINADEPDILDYDTSFKKPAQDALYEPNAFRSSDHDPVIVGLDLTVTPMQAKAHSITVLSSLLPTGDRRDDRRIARAIRNIERSLNPAYWVDDFHLSDKGHKVFDRERTAVRDLMRVDGPAETDAQSVITTLVEADETLAGTAIADAIAAGGDARFIEKAEYQMQDAEYDLSRDRPDKAIGHYKRAWRFAQKALERAPARFATFNASLNRFNAGDLVSELSAPGSDQPATVAEIIQRNRPDVLLINEFDYDADGLAAELFQDNYLSIGQNGAAPIVYPYRYAASSNTGVPSGFDLDNNASVGGPGDAFGFGFFEGQYAFVVYSMHPIRHDKIRTFQNFLWRDMPGALLPELDGTPWYSDEELDVVRLSSKNHVDVPIRIDGDTVHFLISHPTPPVFDGDEDRNGTRNHDEIRFWADYVTGRSTARYIYDDAGKKGGLSRGAQFVIAGDLNSDPFDGDSIPGSAQLLLDHPRVNDAMAPSSPGGTEQAGLQGGANTGHVGDPAFDTADFRDDSPGNLRVDYVLPRYDMDIVGSGVFWPLESDPLFGLVGTWRFPSSDHRLVWIDIDLDG